MADHGKMSLKALFGFIIILILLLPGCKGDSSDDNRGDTNRPEPVKESVVNLEPKQVDLAKITSEAVGKGDMNLDLRLNGEVAFDHNRLTHITSLVVGVVRQVKKTAGDRVEAGTVLVVLSSRELASAKSEYLAARERLELAGKNFERIKSLWKDKIAAEHEYLDARLSLAEAKIAFQTSEQSLYTLGLSPEAVEALPRADRSLLSRYEVRAPFAGTLVAQQVTEGQQVQPDTDLFVLTPMENLWVIASVYEDDVAKIKPGQSGTVSVQAYPDRKFNGRVTWIADVIDQRTHTLRIRLDVPNDMRLLKANMFATVNLVVGRRKGVLIIPARALQMESGDAFVFVETDKGRYERRNVHTGVRSDQSIEIKSGLREGERVVTKGAFILKSELEKGSFGDDD